MYLQDGCIRTSPHPNAHRHTGPRANIVCVGGSGRGCRALHDGGVVREPKKPHLLPFVIASKAWRSSKSRSTAGVPPADHIYTLYSPLYTLSFPRPAPAQQTFCHSRLRGNDRGESARAMTYPNAHRPPGGGGALRATGGGAYVPRICADNIYTLNSTLSTLLLSRCA